jgi:hypothetical protein
MTVERLHELTPYVPGYYRLGCFNRLPRSAQQRILDDLEARTRFHTERQRQGYEPRDWELDTDYVIQQRRKQATPDKPYMPPKADDLDHIEAEVYVQAITGKRIDVPQHGYIRCPLPDHSDSSPSFKLYDTTWNCFSCNRGGRIYHFAGYYWGFPSPLRGTNFIEVKRRLEELFA